MPPILVQLAARALSALGLTLGVETGARAIERFTGVDVPFFGNGGGGAGPIGGRRRRRRMALTSSDVRLSLIIASSISKKAAENFILQRTRPS